MALRDKLRERVQPMLEPGEQIKHVWMMQSGISPYLLGGIGGLIALMVNQYYVVAATDKNIVLFRANKLIPSKPKSVSTRMPLGTQFKPNGKIWGKSELADAKYYIHRRFFDDVARSDSTPRPS
jgi:hypothetical protein